jgi:hypothetical protein
MGDGPIDALAQLKASIESLLDKVELSKYVAVAVASDPPASPATTLMHVRFLEDKANVDSLAQFLWKSAQNYALSRRRRNELRQEMLDAPPGDISIASTVTTAVREAFLDFRKKYPNRASEVGEVLAYCIAVEQLGAAQLAAKMSLKTSPNMPVHGLDGIHAKVENGWLTLFFLESKLSQSANDGVAEFAKSVATFTADQKQYRREYSIVRDMGNFDALSGTDRKVALDYFDVMASPDDVPKRERYVGVVMYSDAKAFQSLPPVDDQQAPGFHEKIFTEAYKKGLQEHQDAAMRHLIKHGADASKCRVYFLVVPDTGVIRERFYQAMGYVPTEET